MSAEFTIRPATITDLERIEEIDAICFPEGSVVREPAAKGELRIGVTENKTLVAESEGSGVVGFVQTVDENYSASVGDRGAETNSLYLAGIGVLPKHRGVGIASSLLERAIAGSQDLAYTVVHPENFTMLRSLFSAGFVATRLIADYFGPGRDRLYLVRRTGARWTSNAQSFSVPQAASGTLGDILAGDGRVLTGVVDTPRGWIYRVERLSEKDPLTVRTEGQSTGVSFTGVLLTVESIFLGFLLASTTYFDESLFALMSVAVVVSLLSSVVYANGSGEIVSGDESRFDYYNETGNILSEFGGVIPVLHIVPLIAATKIDDPIVSVPICVLVGLLTLWYQWSRTDILSRYVPGPERKRNRDRLIRGGLRLVSGWLVISPLVGFAVFHRCGTLEYWALAETGLLLLGGLLCAAAGGEHKSDPRRVIAG